MNIPQHVAIILDGNGRWAKAKGMPRNYGHVQGAKNVEKICEDAYYMGIKYLTDIAAQLHEDLCQDGKEESYACACDRR